MFVETRATGATESRAAAQAVMKVLGLRPWPGLPIETKPRGGALMQWDYRSVSWLPCSRTKRLGRVVATDYGIDRDRREP
jgi:hypothetical protein